MKPRPIYVEKIRVKAVIKISQLKKLDVWFVEDRGKFIALSDSFYDGSWKVQITDSTFYDFGDRDRPVEIIRGIPVFQ